VLPDGVLAERPDSHDPIPLRRGRHLLSLVYSGMASQGLANTWAACTTYTSAYILKDCGCTPGNPGGPFSTPLVFRLRCPLAGRVWTLEIDYCGCFNDGLHQHLRAGLAAHGVLRHLFQLVRL
jgi:hypothetical protein